VDHAPVVFYQSIKSLKDHVMCARDLSSVAVKFSDNRKVFLRWRW